MNDCMTAESGLCRQAFAWGIFIKAYLLGAGQGYILVTIVAIHQMSFTMLRFQYLSHVCTLIAPTWKGVLKIAQEST